MLYAIVGIPLTLLTITNLGSFMATAFRFIYKNILCGLCCICCTSGVPSSRRRSQRRSRRNVELQELEAGLSAGEETINGSVEKRSTTSTPVRGRGTVRRRSPRRPRIPLRERFRQIFETDNIKNVTVPIYVSLILITGYIALGALLFTLWEKEWNYLIGCYFCFITLSTIGFGDFVPGTSPDAWNSQEKLVLCALYLLVGLALLAMCFDLMQEQARANFRALGKKLGLLSD